MKLKKDNFENIVSHRIPNVSSVEILCESHQFKIKGDFRISRGSKSVAQVFYFRYKYTLENGDVIIGQGESVPYARYGESFESVLSQIEAVRGQLEAPIILAELQDILPPGAARNAVDCALWDVNF